VPMPATDRLEDIDAARRALVEDNGRLFSHTAWLDPILMGQHWPSVARHLDGVIQPGDMEIARQPLDFLGLNIYHGTFVEAGEDGKVREIPSPLDRPETLLYWPVRPESLYWGPRFLYERYHLPIYITENGMSGHDWVALDGQVHDPQRIDYVQRYLQQYRKAGEDGVDIRGYFHWSLMDNLEWTSAMRHKFGLIHVDFATQQRTLKDSARWYQDVIRTNGTEV